MIRNPIITCLVTVCVLLISNVNAQDKNLPIASESNLITYDEVIEREAESKDDLYHKAYSWATTFYKNPNSVIREKDVLNGIIVCKGRFRIVTPATKKRMETPAGIVQYMLTIQLKDNKYKYTVTNINWKQTSYYPIEKWMDKTKQSYVIVYDSYLEQTDEQVMQIIESLKIAMAKALPQNSEDW